MTLAVGSNQIGGMRLQLRQPTGLDPPCELLDRRLLGGSLGPPEEVLGQSQPVFGGFCLEPSAEGRWVVL